MTRDLSKSLERWISSGLIHGDQAQRIQEYENAHAAHSHEHSWILNGFVILGAAVISIGIISQIAAHWENIPDWLKLMGSFLGLIGLAGTAWGYREKNSIIFDTALLFLFLLCLGTIGLISQIYHTTGPLYRLLLFWCSITVGVAYFARHLLVPWLWTGALLGGFTLTIYEAPLFSRIQPTFTEYPGLIGIILFFLCGAMALIRSTLLANNTLKGAFKAWTLIIGLGSLALFDLSFNSPHSGRFPSELSASIMNASVILYSLAVIAFTMLVFSEEYTKGQKVGAVLIFLSFLGIAHVSILTDSAFWRAFLTIISLMLMAIFLAGIDCKRLFTFLLSLIGLRFLILYFQALGSLALTGLGLILSGLTIIAGAFLWQKYRHSLFTWSHKLIS